MMPAPARSFHYVAFAAGVTVIGIFSLRFSTLRRTLVGLFLISGIAARLFAAEIPVVLSAKADSSERLAEPVFGVSVRVTFTEIVDGPVAKGGVLSGFTVAGDDNKFRHRAEARIEGAAVIVTAAVPAPVAVRDA